MLCCVFFFVCVCVCVCVAETKHAVLCCEILDKWRFPCNALTISFARTRFLTPCVDSCIASYRLTCGSTRSALDIVRFCLCYCFCVFLWLCQKKFILSQNSKLWSLKPPYFVSTNCEYTVSWGAARVRRQRDACTHRLDSWVVKWLYQKNLRVLLLFNFQCFFFCNWICSKVDHDATISDALQASLVFAGELCCVRVSVVNAVNLNKTILIVCVCLSKFVTVIALWKRAGGDWQPLRLLQQVKFIWSFVIIFSWKKIYI